jgi:hypothetical protein
LSRRSSAQIGFSDCQLRDLSCQLRSSFLPSATAAVTASLFCKSSHQYHSTRFTAPLFSYSYALFCTAQDAISNPFCAFRTLCGKHPGWGIPPFSLRGSAHSASLRYPFPRLHPSALAEPARPQ